MIAPQTLCSMLQCPLLIAAVASANERMVKTLVASGADIEIKDSKRCSPLHHATARGYRLFEVSCPGSSVLVLVCSAVS